MYDDFKSEALCADGTTDFWSENPRQQHEAKQVCSQCEVAYDCLVYALAIKPKQGVWGGHTWEEIRKLRRRLSRIPLVSRASQEARTQIIMESLETSLVNAQFTQDPLFASVIR